MTRPLLLVAACAFVAMLVCFAIARAMGPLVFNDYWVDHNWGGPWRGMHGSRGPVLDPSGPTATRVLTWPGGTELRVVVPATIEYRQGSPAHVEVSGPKNEIDHVVVDDEVIRFDARFRDPQPIRIVMTAPDVREFGLAGAQTFTATGLDQDEIEFNLAGAGKVNASGRARSIDLKMAGAVDADLGGLKAEDAEIHIAGAGGARMSVRNRAEVHIAGAGDVTFLERPQSLETHIFGSGAINQPPPGGPAPGASRVEPDQGDRRTPG
jgi:hypothetical protein